MKKFRGILSVLSFIIISGGLWYMAEPVVEISNIERWSYVVGGSSLAGFVSVFVMAVRNKKLDHWFGGLDKVYVYHKYIAIGSLALVFVHAILSESIRSTSSGVDHFAVSMGSLSRLLFIILTIIALFAKRLKYEQWRFFHRLMIIPYAFGVYHTYFNGRYDLLQMTVIGIWMAVTTIIGAGSGLYMLIFYQKVQFRHRGKITSIRNLSDKVMEIEITLRHLMDYQEGQYVFLKIYQKGIEKAPHPFSISGGDGKKIYLTIKVLGDYTEDLFEKLNLNTGVSLEGPYGQMTFAKGGNYQVWIAGGIGIAPFISYLRRNRVKENIDFYYSYRGEEEAIFKSFLEEYAAEYSNFKLHLHNTANQGRLDFSDYHMHNQAVLYMCGPVQMIKNYSKQFKNLNQNVKMEYEAFEFR